MADAGLNLHDLDSLLRRCVACGLCLPHCATWAETGNEVHSPRGRLMLLADLLETGDGPMREMYSEAFDHCIGCRACETACPGGVPYSLLEAGQKMTHGTTPSSPGIPGPLFRRLDSPPVLRSVGGLGRATRGILRAGLGPTWRRRLDGLGSRPGHWGRLLGTLPRAPGDAVALMRQLDGLQGVTSRVVEPEAAPASGPVVRVFRGCANEGLMPRTTDRLIQLLRAGGCTVDDLQGQEDCCGALAAHTGRPGRESLLKRANNRALARLEDLETVVVVEAAGCGHHLKGYGGQAADRVEDALVMLDRLRFPALRSLELNVAYHDPCHALHGQGIHAEPRRLLDRIPGLSRQEPAEAEMCCGSGGAWGLNHPELSARIGRRKARQLAATGARLVVTANPGCLGQIADGLSLEAPRLPIIPLSDLLWYAVFTRPV